MAGILFVVLVVCVALLLWPLAKMADNAMLDNAQNPLSEGSGGWLYSYYQAWINTYAGTPLSPKGSSWPFWLVLVLAFYAYQKSK